MSNTCLSLTLAAPFRLAHCWLLLPQLLPVAQAWRLNRLQSSNIAHPVALTDSISLHEVQSSSSSSELAAPIALQTPTHTFNLNLTRDQYADLIESLQHLNQQAQNQQPSLITLGRRIDAQLHPQQRTSLHPHRQAQAVLRWTFIDTYRAQQIELYNNQLTHSIPSLVLLQLSHSHQSEAPSPFQSSPILLQNKSSEESFPLRDQPLSLETTAKETLKSWSLRLKLNIKQFWNAYLEQISGDKNYQNHNERCPFRNGALTWLSNHGFRKQTNFSSLVRRPLF